ncbi:hypothetical protein DRH27_05320, partial [Candidatus Falkowbacteria bacterium]
NSIFDTIENELKKGAKTIIAVGNNQTYNQTINALVRQYTLNSVYKKIPLGFIPVGNKNNEIADYLGYTSEEASCGILSARRIQKLDLAQANNIFFLSQAVITTVNTTLEIDKNYTIEINESGEIAVINLPAMQKLPLEINSNAKDGILELFIKSNKTKKYLPLNLGQTNQSIFSFKKLRIINPSSQVVLDSSIKLQTPVAISISNFKINLIVGKNRQF